ncbi:hypothetical protein QE152_g30855 [Popillia japonica]|uniref:Uncharacterized protein n=1 Tax=Popillia japonica TaxID=7064 RepID=A0AAW1JCV5_POPJA
MKEMMAEWFNPTETRRLGRQCLELWRNRTPAKLLPWTKKKIQGACSTCTTNAPETPMIVASAKYRTDSLIMYGNVNGNLRDSHFSKIST